MDILFCNNPFQDKTVDTDFEKEYFSAREVGFNMHLFSFESLVKDDDALSSTRRIRSSDVLKQIIYRGWMLTPSQYLALYKALLIKNFQLINSAEEYQNCHYLPDSYKFINGNSPKTIWIAVENGKVDYERVFEEINVFHNSPLVVKDFVKSQKHYWDTACFIPSASDKEKVKSVINRFLELQGSDLNVGLVIREFVELNDLAIHTKSGMPLKQEYRLFFLKGHLVECYDYWEEGDYFEKEKPPLEFFESIAKNIRSNFFSMDVAKTKEGKWIIIELGDGQVAGLPENADTIQFYKAIKACVKD